MEKYFVDSYGIWSGIAGDHLGAKRGFFFCHVSEHLSRVSENLAVKAEMHQGEQRLVTDDFFQNYREKSYAFLIQQPCDVESLQSDTIFI